MSQRTSPLPEPTSADASRQGSQASEEPSLTGRCSASEQTLHGGPYPLRQQTSAVEFYDMAVDDEPGDRAASVASETWDEQKVQHISAGLDFLGFVENKKLVPAVSSFRRMLKKSARTAARHKEKEQQDQTKGQKNEALMSGLEVAQSQRHQRRQSVRERSRERQRGSMVHLSRRLWQSALEKLFAPGGAWRPSSLPWLWCPKKTTSSARPAMLAMNARRQILRLKPFQRWSLPAPARRPLGSASLCRCREGKRPHVAASLAQIQRTACHQPELAIRAARVVRAGVRGVPAHPKRWMPFSSARGQGRLPTI